MSEINTKERNSDYMSIVPEKLLFSSRNKLMLQEHRVKRRSLRFCVPLVLFVSTQKNITECQVFADDAFRP